MASRSRTRRSQPYDLDNPANWSAAQLRSELLKKGYTFTSSVPKSALKQIYDQIVLSDRSDSNNLESVQQLETEEITSVQEDSTSNQNIPSDVITVGTNSNTTLDSMNAEVICAASTVGSTHTSGTATLSNIATNDVTSALVQNTLGMVSSMQSTMSSLQSTINTLLTKTSPGMDKPNQLEKFYTSTSVPTDPQPLPVYTNLRNGVPADELPHIDVVTDSVKRNILAGKYVNLACLLIPDFETPSVSADMSGLDYLKRDRKDHRLDRPLSISQFFKAFGIYKRVMCETYPLRRMELDLYEADIGNIYEHYGNIFYQYHVQFTRQAAAYMEKGIKVDWSKRHKDLFQLIVGGTKTQSCDHCGQTDHQSSFCSTQIDVQITSHLKKFTDSSRFNVTKDRTHDLQGRLRVMYKGREICNNFNGVKGCSFKTCNFHHVCKNCKQSTHGQSSCNQSKTILPEATTSSEKTKSKN